ncbi:hypothetical protein EVAR_33941_1 [Eumeta japonica]|uniref:Uncharacterized protein n=1 Tax=Eumeta variegata TaxID=151549 RepID=A0A4C1VX90_EUMVA|nr:hypothetical protein EVAR_33941_1 [Eumeta japonica]
MNDSIKKKSMKLRVSTPKVMGFELRKRTTECDTYVELSRAKASYPFVGGRPVRSRRRRSGGRWEPANYNLFGEVAKSGRPPRPSPSRPRPAPQPAAPFAFALRYGLTSMSNGGAGRATVIKSITFESESTSFDPDHVRIDHCRIENRSLHMSKCTLRRRDVVIRLETTTVSRPSPARNSLPRVQRRGRREEEWVARRARAGAGAGIKREPGGGPPWIPRGVLTN